MEKRGEGRGCRRGRGEKGLQRGRRDKKDRNKEEREEEQKWGDGEQFTHAISCQSGRRSICAKTGASRYDSDWMGTIEQKWRTMYCRVLWWCSGSSL